MRFKVIVEPQDVVRSLGRRLEGRALRAVGALRSADGDVDQGPGSVRLCLACHRVEGTECLVRAGGPR